MAVKTRLEMIDLALERLGIKSPEQAAKPEEVINMGVVFDGVYSQLRNLGIAPFTTAAVPEWAQVPFASILAANSAVTYGFSGERLMAIMQEGDRGEKMLYQQTATKLGPSKTKGTYY